MSRHDSPRFVATATGNEGGSSYRYGAERSTAQLQFDACPSVAIHGRLEGSTPYVRVVACQDGRHRVLYDGPMDRILSGEDVQPRAKEVADDFKPCDSCIRFGNEVKNPLKHWPEDCPNQEATCANC